MDPDEPDGSEGEHIRRSRGSARDPYRAGALPFTPHPRSLRAGQPGGGLAGDGLAQTLAQQPGMAPGPSPQPGQWVEREAYRFKTPDKERRAEMSRIHRGDEAALAALRQRKLLELLPCNRPLGASTSTSEPATVREGREGLLRRLEKDQDPVQARLRKKEKEQSRRQKEQEELDEKRRRHADGWHARQRVEAERARELNERAKRHWQGIQGASSAAADPTGSGVPGISASGLPGSAAKPGVPGPGVPPGCAPSRADTTAAPTSTAQASPAPMSPATARMSCAMCSRPIALNSVRWFDDLALCGRCVARSQQAPDHLPEGQRWTCVVCTLSNEPGALECDACGTPAVFADSAVGGDSGAGVAGSGAPGPAGAPATAQPGTAKAGPSAARAARLLEWLRAKHLEEYHANMLEHGFDVPAELAELEAADIEDMLRLVGVKPGHRSRFTKALKDPAAGQAAASDRALLECPICLVPRSDCQAAALLPCGHVYCEEHAAAALKKERCFVCRQPPIGQQQLFV